MAVCYALPRGTARGAALTGHAAPRLARRTPPSVNAAPIREAKSDSMPRPVGSMDETRLPFPLRRFPVAARPTLRPSANIAPDTHNRRRDRFPDTGPVYAAGALDHCDTELQKTIELL